MTARETLLVAIRRNLDSLGPAAVEPPPGELHGGQERQDWLDANFEGGYSAWRSYRALGPGGSRPHLEWERVRAFLLEEAELKNYVRADGLIDFRVGEFPLGWETNSYNAYSRTLGAASAERSQEGWHPTWMSYANVQIDWVEDPNTGETVAIETPVWEARPTWWDRKLEETYSDVLWKYKPTFVERTKPAPETVVELLELVGAPQAEWPTEDQDELEPPPADGPFPLPVLDPARPTPAEQAHVIYWRLAPKVDAYQPSRMNPFGAFAKLLLQLSLDVLQITAEPAVRLYRALADERPMNVDHRILVDMQEEEAAE
ncbi:MAG: hypothetical protein AAF690_15995 [Acidobacteriota bacterium]